eukprot:scaffold541_cov335-Pavlova_lutheri.AAC.23
MVVHASTGSANRSVPWTPSSGMSPPKSAGWSRTFGYVMLPTWSTSTPCAASAPLESTSTMTIAFLDTSMPHKTPVSSCSNVVHRVLTRFPRARTRLSSQPGSSNPRDGHVALHLDPKPKDIDRNRKRYRSERRGSSPLRTHSKHPHREKVCALGSKKITSTTGASRTT